MAKLSIKPDVLSLIVCDQIITDRVTGKQSLIGMFSTVHARGFPVTQPQLAVHVSLTDGRGKTPITIRIVDSDEDRAPVVEGRGQVDFKNPRAIANLALQFHGLTFPQPGEYRVQLLSEGELLREARLAVVLARRRPPRPDMFTDPADPPDRRLRDGFAADRVREIRILVPAQAVARSDLDLCHCDIFSALGGNAGSIELFPAKQPAR